jgi:hypothetical protein
MHERVEDMQIRVDGSGKQKAGEQESGKQESGKQKTGEQKAGEKGNPTCQGCERQAFAFGQSGGGEKAGCPVTGCG